MTDDHDDAALAASLRRHADELAGPIDTEAALAEVRRRGAARRRRRQVTSAALAVAAAAVAVVAGTVVLGDDRQTVRTPAAATGPASSGPATTVASTTSAPVTTVTPTTNTVPPPTPTAPSLPASSAPSSSPTTVAPTVARYDSVGGSISVRVVDGVVRLDGDPMPSSGWTYRVDDDGPDRVRVRFERDSERSEIRVELVGGQLLPEIIEN